MDFSIVDYGFNHVVQLAPRILVDEARRNDDAGKREVDELNAYTDSSEE